MIPRQTLQGSGIAAMKWLPQRTWHSTTKKNTFMMEEDQPKNNALI